MSYAHVTAPVTQTEVEVEVEVEELLVQPTQRSAVGGVGGAEWIDALVERGVVPTNAQALIAAYDQQRVADAVAWFDSQPTGAVGAGLLVRAVREGRSPLRRQAVSQQRDYWRSLEAWLEGAFPEFGAHPAAAAAVMRLHRRHGRGSVTRREHGPIIRAAVDRWERRYA